MKTSFGLLYLILVIHGSLHAQVMPLDSVFYYIDTNNPMLKQYDARVRAKEAYVQGSSAWMAPMVGVGPYWVPYVSEGEGKQGMYMALVEQDIPNPSKIKSRKAYASSLSRVEGAARANQFNQLRSEAKTLYFNSIVAMRQLRILDENKRVAEAMVKLARIRYSYNQGTLANIYKAEASINEIENMRIMTEGEIEQSMIRLKSIMNIPQSRSITVDTTTLIGFRPVEEVDTTELVNRRSDIRQLDQTINSMRLNQRLQQTGAKPDFRIRFEHMQARNPEMPNMFSAMAMVTIPIAPWASKMYKSEASGMSAEIEAMKIEREAILLETEGMVRSMQIQLSRMEKQLENYRGRILPALKKNYESVMVAYEENREQLPVVIDAWEAYTMAQSEYLNKSREYYTMIVSYEKALEQ